MASEEVGRPIPTIVGRGKNRLKRPQNTHTYGLRSSGTARQSIRNNPCSFCTHYKTAQEEAVSHNTKLRSQLLKTTVRTLVTERWKRQRDEKIKKLRGLLSDRANEIRESERDLQLHLRDARVRKTELQTATTQLQSCQEEIADLHKKLEDETKKTKTFEEMAMSRGQQVNDMQANVQELLEQIAPLLDDLDGIAASISVSDDVGSLSVRLNTMRATLLELKSLHTKTDVDEVEDVCNSRTLLDQLLVEVICGVCQEMFLDPVALPCGHVFCEFCIRMWFKRCRGCPVCRHRIVSCGQLHAIYQFRQVVALLDRVRSLEERSNRESEISRREELRHELYSDPPLPMSRRSRERPSSSTERFSHRRRRLDQEIASVPYPIPPPDPRLATVRLNVRDPAINPPMFPPSETVEQALSGISEASRPEPSRNMMTALLNETFSSIDRLIRGSDRLTNPLLLPGTQSPLQMIEFNPERPGPALRGAFMRDVHDVLEEQEEGQTEHSTMTGQYQNSPGVGGTWQNPILIQEYIPIQPGTIPEISQSGIPQTPPDRSTREPQTPPREPQTPPGLPPREPQTPPGIPPREPHTPPPTEPQTPTSPLLPSQMGLMESDSSEEIWPNFMDLLAPFYGGGRERDPPIGLLRTDEVGTSRPGLGDDVATSTRGGGDDVATSTRSQGDEVWASMRGRFGEVARSPNRDRVYPETVEQAMITDVARSPTRDRVYPERVQAMITADDTTSFTEQSISEGELEISQSEASISESEISYDSETGSSDTGTESTATVRTATGEHFSLEEVD